MGFGVDFRPFFLEPGDFGDTVLSHNRGAGEEGEQLLAAHPVHDVLRLLLRPSVHPSDVGIKDGAVLGHGNDSLCLGGEHDAFNLAVLDARFFYNLPAGSAYRFPIILRILFHPCRFRVIGGIGCGGRGDDAAGKIHQYCFIGAGADIVGENIFFHSVSSFLQQSLVRGNHVLKYLFKAVQCIVDDFVGGSHGGVEPASG